MQCGQSDVMGGGFLAYLDSFCLSWYPLECLHTVLHITSANDVALHVSCSWKHVTHTTLLGEI